MKSLEGDNLGEDEAGVELGLGVAVAVAVGVIV